MKEPSAYDWDAAAAEELESLAWWNGDRPAWSAEDEQLVRWFEARMAELPREPFRLGPGLWVSDPDRFFAQLRTEIAAGPGSTRARSGALQEDLERLRALFGGNDRPA